MFTGLVEQIGRIARVTTDHGRRRLRIAHEPWDAPLAVGDSVAVSGTCLTVETATESAFTCSVLDETYQRSGFAHRPVGSAVNLERALRVGDRLGGHMVQGHVDGTGHVATLQQEGRDWRLRIRCDATLLEGIVAKGSIAIEGVSLTVSEVDATGFEVRLIPLTWDETTLHTLAPEGCVALELDILGKYARKALGTASPGISESTLRDAGY